MQHSFWLERWQEDRIGFHQNIVNPYLSKYWASLKLSHGSPVFVPLCGKSNDLIYLHEQGHKVIGNELSPLAVTDFYTEQQLIASKSVLSNEKNYSDEQSLVHWESAKADIMCGDFFLLKKQHLPDISAVYDRAALVALPLEMRHKYVIKLLELMPEQVSIFLITLEYDEKEKQGPPFSVPEREVRQHFQEYFDINLLEVQDINEDQRSPASQNMSYFRELVFLLSR